MVEGLNQMLPKIIDLFSGCGGLALGFTKAGFKLAGGIEIVQKAYDTLNYNLYVKQGKEKNHICGDITELSPSIFKNNLSGEGCIVIGGPPCQAYSLAGKGKLRSLGEDRVNTKDARGFLYKEFLRFVYGLGARAVLMENVPESTNFGGKNIPEIVCSDLEQHGYSAFWTILCSADYGVPQVRERVFVFGIKQNENKIISLPKPTNYNNKGIAPYYLKRVERFKKYTHFTPPQVGKTNLPNWVTVGEAFSDLPSLFPTATSKYKQFDLTTVLKYKTGVLNNFQNLMRTWSSKSTTDTVSCNCFRNTRRDFCIFDRMQTGANYVEASEIAISLFIKEAKVRGFLPNTEEYNALKKEMVPPYDTTKFQNKWLRLDPNRPSHTVTAHLCKDTYSHIHPWEPRGISVREAARLQSFPDDFEFKCDMGNAFKQIGNAVPPLLSLGVAKAIKKAFR